MGMDFYSYGLRRGLRRFVYISWVSPRPLALHSVLVTIFVSYSMDFFDGKHHIVVSTKLLRNILWFLAKFNI